MLPISIVAGVLALAGVPAAQTVSPDTTGTLSASEVGTAPLAGQSGPAFVVAASDANLFQIKAAQLAASKAQRDDVKAYAKRVLSETQTSSKSLMAALRNDERTIKAPASMLSSTRAAQLKLLEKAPRGSFDNLYLTQSAQVQQASWSVFKGYAIDGTDVALKQVAGEGVPQIEQGLANGKALLPAALAGNR